jgi:cell wall assembly regulator SMI1
MKKIIKKLTDVALLKVPSAQIKFNPGVPKNEIEEFEKLINKKLPNDFKKFYSLANGNAGESIKLFNGLNLISIEEITQSWNSNRELLNSGAFKNTKADTDKAIKSDWWNVNWIPITDNMSGDHLVIDLDPTEDGTYGQIFNYWHDPSYRAIEAMSFTDFLNKTIEEIENGILRYDADYNAFIKF